jgi:hypothetical protein
MQCQPLAKTTARTTSQTFELGRGRNGLLAGPRRAFRCSNLTSATIDE